MPRNQETPRRRKKTKSASQPGIRHISADVNRLGTIVASRLHLPFQPEPWQAALIHKISQGYDSIFCAGTSYGKSLIFHGLAAFERDSTFIVICPLKVLELDQVREATGNNLKAIAINEDTIKADSSMWARAQKEHFNLIYISPELAIGSNSPMLCLWRDPNFCKHLGAIIVDEAHCIDEWGEKFRVEYRELRQLRTFSGFEIPMVACSATMPTSTFDVIWDALEYGHRPFWGLDVGTVHQNLFYSIRTIPTTKDLLLHVLNILPLKIPHDMPRDMIPKTIIYFPSVDLCVQFTRKLRKCLPSNLCDAVMDFTAGKSDKGKKHIWENFLVGTTHILVSTEATALGCNDKRIEYCFVYLAQKDPRSLSVLAQRWGRAGHTRGMHAFCFFFVPPWAVCPPPQDSNMQRLKGIQTQTQTKTSSRQAALHGPLEGLINLKYAAAEDRCFHKYLAKFFHPDTKLDQYTALPDDINPSPTSRGERSLRRPDLSLSWTVLDLGIHPDPDRCCDLCNPEHGARLVPVALANDPRLSAYAEDFFFGLAERVPSPALSQLSGTAVSVQTASSRGRRNNRVVIPQDSRDALRKALREWRTEFHNVRSGSRMTTPRMLFPDRVVDGLVDNAASFVTAPIIDSTLIRSQTPWTLGNDDVFQQIAAVISRWRDTSTITCQQPSSGRGNRKKARSETTPATSPIRGGTAHLPLHPVACTPMQNESDPLGPVPVPNMTPTRTVAGSSERGQSLQSPFMSGFQTPTNPSPPYFGRHPLAGRYPYISPHHSPYPQVPLVWVPQHAPMPHTPISPHFTPYSPTQYALYASPPGYSPFHSMTPQQASQTGVHSSQSSTSQHPLSQSYVPN